MRHVGEGAVTPVHPHVLRLRRDLLDRALHLHEAGLDGEIERRLEFAGVRHAAPARLAQLFQQLLGFGRDEIPGRCADRGGVLHVDEARRDVDERLVGAVPVDHQDAVEAVVAERAAEVEQVLDEDVPAQGHRAGEVQVVRRVAVHCRREEQRGAALGVDALAGAARDLLDQAHVGVDRQVVAVILERGRRDHDDDVVAAASSASSGQVCCS